MEQFEEILERAKTLGASDIHLVQASPVMLRVDGTLVPMSEKPVESDMIATLAETMLTEQQEKILEQKGEVEFAYDAPGFGRLRANVFRQRSTYAVALRLLQTDIPAPKSLGVPEVFAQLTAKRCGLMLVAGEAGSGITTTVAALVQEIAKNHAKRIITLEDSIEYLYQNHKSMVLQREIGNDSASYADALRAALKQDADVILVGELRDRETVSLALAAAEMGHLVLSTMHINSAVSVAEHLIGMFPANEQRHICVRMADALLGIAVQQLLPRQLGKGRMAAFEVMLANPAVQNLIRGGKIAQLFAVMQGGFREGMRLMDDAIYDLYMKSEISSETAILYAQDPAEMGRKVQLF